MSNSSCACGKIPNVIATYMHAVAMDFVNYIVRPVRATITLHPIGRPVRATYYYTVSYKETG